ncbi:MAG: hypothetical protein ACRDV9_01910, partial [Acidimicrobiia bacterium]
RFWIATDDIDVDDEEMRTTRSRPRALADGFDTINLPDTPGGATLGGTRPRPRDGSPWWRLGWIVVGDRRGPVEGADSLKVRSRYLMPMWWTEEPEPERQWSYLAANSLFPVLADDRVQPTASPLSPSVGGKTVQEVAADLARTPPDPVAQKYQHLRPLQRVQAVGQEKYENRKAGHPQGEVNEGTK